MINRGNDATLINKVIVKNKPVGWYFCTTFCKRRFLLVCLLSFSTYTVTPVCLGLESSSRVGNMVIRYVVSYISNFVICF